MESPLRREAHGGFGERPGETDREQSRHRAPGRLNHVEQSFRMSKTDLAARPMFDRTRDAIEAHLAIVFTALAVSCRAGPAYRSAGAPANSSRCGRPPSRSTA